VIQHVPHEMKLGEIHVAIDRPQDTRCAQEAIVPSRMNGVEPIAQCLRPRHLQDDRRRHVAGLGDGGVVQQDVQSTARDPHVDDWHGEGIGKQPGIRGVDESPEGFRSADTKNMGLRRIARRRAKP
jgi:hypothetical protein